MIINELHLSEYVTKEHRKFTDRRYQRNNLQKGIEGNNVIYLH